MDKYLASSEVINWKQPDVLAKAKELRGESDDSASIARACFEYVRDEIKHSGDFELNPVTYKASDVLKHETGYCYAKSHLLAALLRANNIPAGICYQRLTTADDKLLFCLHGLNAVFLPDVGWYRIDARGNKPGVDAQFAPPVEELAFAATIEGEADLPEIWPEPLPQVVEVLESSSDYRQVADNLPDVELAQIGKTASNVLMMGVGPSFVDKMFRELEKINARPEPFECYTAADLWTDEHTSRQMLSFHLNEQVDLSSRNAAFIDRSVEWIASEFTVGAGTKIADFGCGPGLYATRLARKDADVTGIDFSSRSIRYAQQVATNEGLSIHYKNQDYLEFETDERFDLILMIMCDFCALSPAQRKKMLGKFHTILESGGFVLLDVYSLTAFDRREETAMYEANLLDGFWSSERYYGFLNRFKYESEKVVLDKYTIVEASRTRTVYNWLQYFSPGSLEREFTECGFAVEKLYSDVAGSPFEAESKEFAVVASKQ